MARLGSTTTSSDKSDEKVTRTRRTPEQKATADLEKAQKAVDKANERIQKANDELTKAQAEADRANRFLAYAQANPDLPQDNGAINPEPAPEDSGEVSATDPAA